MLTLTRLKSLLNYDEVRGIFTWANGAVAGSLHFKGYRRITIDRKEYLEHRLAWFYSYGSWPVDQIDHINGNKADNRLSNLRPASRFENGRNRPRLKNNKAGHKGVSWHKGNKRWRAQITRNHQDYFLGYFNSAQDAADAYNRAALEYHGEFAMLDL